MSCTDRRSAMPCERLRSLRRTGPSQNHGRQPEVRRAATLNRPSTGVQSPLRRLRPSSPLRNRTVQRPRRTRERPRRGRRRLREEELPRRTRHPRLPRAQPRRPPLARLRRQRAHPRRDPQPSPRPVRSRTRPATPPPRAPLRHRRRTHRARVQPLPRHQASSRSERNLRHQSLLRGPPSTPLSA